MKQNAGLRCFSQNYLKVASICFKSKVMCGEKFENVFNTEQNATPHKTSKHFNNSVSIRYPGSISGCCSLILLFFQKYKTLLKLVVLFLFGNGQCRNAEMSTEPIRGTTRNCLFLHSHFMSVYKFTKINLICRYFYRLLKAVF